MDCKKCLNQCKSECCSVVPLPIHIYNKYVSQLSSNTIFSPVYKDSNGNQFICIMNENKKCAFLKEDGFCKIYEERPDICKKFGNEETLMMTCKYQDKTGKIRIRSERNRIGIEQQKRQKQFIKILK